jgi:hypothetical protein
MEHVDLLSPMNKKRMANLRALAARYDQQADLAAALGITPSYLSQLIGPRPSRGISERTARTFERKLSLVYGILDGDPPEAPSLNTTSGDALDSVMLQVDNALRAGGLRLSEDKYRALVAHCYRAAVRSGNSNVDATELQGLLKLIK